MIVLLPPFVELASFNKKFRSLGTRVNSNNLNAWPDAKHIEGTLPIVDLLQSNFLILAQ